MKVVTALDDLEIIKGNRVNADHTVRVSVQIDDGPVRVAALDLTQENTDGVLEYVEDLFKAAPEETPRRPYTQRRDTPMAQARQTANIKRMWVEQNKLRAKTGRDRPACEAPGGGWYWPKWLDLLWQEAQAGRGNYPLPAIEQE